MINNPAPHSMPMVSICIPAYNRVNYIQDTICSILAQNYPNTEIIVQDNASTDGTWEILEKLAKEHPQLSIQRNSTNLGAVPNWNLAMNRARGEYVMWLSSDDLLEPGFIDESLRAFKEHNPDAVATNYYILRDSGKSIRKKKLNPGIYEHYYQGLLRNPAMFTINFTLFKWETMEQLRVRGNPMELRLMACDYDLFFRFIIAGKKMYYLDKPLGTYRIHESNDSKQTKRLRRHTIMVILRHRRVIKQNCPLAYWVIMFRYAIRLLRPTTYDKRLMKAVCREVRLC